MYQIVGTLSARCMSFDSIGLPLAVCCPAITQLFDPDAHPMQAGRPSTARSELISSKASASPGLEREDRTTRPRSACAPLACVRSSSSSSSLEGGGSGWGWLRSNSTPVGGRSRHEPTGYNSDSSLELFSLAATRSRDSFTSQCVSSVSTIIIPMERESAPLQGWGR